jgi:membrane associated rhomboid family serine protease
MGNSMARMIAHEDTAIETRTHQRAMDWSLVLASQGIECVIEQRSEDGAWLLLVNGAEAARAFDAIRAYERENTNRWHTPVKWTGQVFDWRAVFWWALVAVLFALEHGSRPGLRDAGIMDRARFLDGEWWRALTAVTLHADVGHLMLNATIGVVLLGLVMGCFGAGTGLLTAFLSGAAANVIEVFVRVEAYRGLGASGMVMGALGLLAGHSVWERAASRREWIGRGVLAAGLLFLLLGLSERGDVLAHVLGFVCGVALGLAAGWRGPASRGWQVAAGLFCAALVLGAWMMALRIG